MEAAADELEAARRRIADLEADAFVVAWNPFVRGACPDEALRLQDATAHLMQKEQADGE